MVVRRRRKKNKLRGHRTHGAGGTKNRRGSGCRGGVGRAGSHKHKFSKYYMDFGTKITLKPKKKGISMNLAEFSSMLGVWAEKKLVEMKGNSFVVDCSKIGVDKLLGRGELSAKVELSNVKASRKAVEKIEAAGGSLSGEIAAESEEDGEQEEAEEE